MAFDKKQKEKHKKILAIGLTIATAISILDILGSKFWLSMGELRHTAYALAEAPYLKFFWYFAYFVILITTLAYYLGSRDKSESLAIGTASLFFIWSGLADILYFIFQGKWLPETMPWLIDKMPGVTSKYLLGQSTVTPFGLVLNTIIFVIAGYFITRWLVKQKW